MDAADQMLTLNWTKDTNSIGLFSTSYLDYLINLNV